MAFKIPGFGGATDAITNAIKPLFREVFDKVIDFLWKPLEPWLGGIWNTGKLAALLVGQVSGGIVRMSGAIGHFFDHGDEYIAHWIVAGFKLWFDPIVNLVEDALDEALGD